MGASTRSEALVIASGRAPEGNGGASALAIGEGDVDTARRILIASARGGKRPSEAVGVLQVESSVRPAMGVNSVNNFTVGYFVGSLAKASLNRLLSKALIRLAPPGL